MSEKRPQWRDYDDTPKRGDDTHIEVPWFKYEGSGRLLVALLMSLAMLVGSGGGVLYGWYHDRNMEMQHQSLVMAIDTLISVVSVQTCVLTLSNDERREFREQGKYCALPQMSTSRRQQLPHDGGFLK